MRETIVYKGIRFRRYPDSPHATHRRYYNPGPADRAKGVDSLHREIWKDHHGPIPEGCDIHHRDGNPLNNQIDNLIATTREEHRALHSEALHQHNTSPEHLAHLEAIRDKAAEWHRSEEGRAWHREHGQRVWGHREPRTFQCLECQIEFLSTVYGVKANAVGRFCSTVCSQRHHARAGTFLKERVCPICQHAFKSPAKRETCSRECGARLRWDRTGRTSKR
jgi:hypothetical protein